jgi:hypothetical protein
VSDIFNPDLIAVESAGVFQRQIEREILFGPPGFVPPPIPKPLLRNRARWRVRQLRMLQRRIRQWPRRTSNRLRERAALRLAPWLDPEDF